MATNLAHLIAWTSPNRCVHPIPYPIPFHRGWWRRYSCTVYSFTLSQRTFPTSIKMLNVSERIIISRRFVAALPVHVFIYQLTGADADSGIAVLSGGRGSRDLDSPPGHRVPLPRARKRVVLRVIFDNNMPLTFLSLHTCTRALSFVFQ